MSMLNERYEEPGDFSKGRSLEGMTFHRTRGRADFFSEPSTAEGLIRCVRKAAEAGIPVSVIGSGTHTVISDGGVRGLLISTRRLKGITIKGNLITAKAGESLDDVINEGLDHNLAGLEGLGGIPGTVAAALKINAENNGTKLSDRLLYFDYISHDGRIHRRPNYADMYGKHTTQIDDDEIILSVTLAMKPERRTAEKRVEKERNIELMFVPPASHFLAKVFTCREGNPEAVMQNTDLREDEARRCRFSQDDPNYMLCTPDCTLTEMVELMERTKMRVREKHGVVLVPSVSFLGEFDGDLDAKLSFLAEKDEASVPELQAHPHAALPHP